MFGKHSVTLDEDPIICEGSIRPERFAVFALFGLAFAIWELFQAYKEVAGKKVVYCQKPSVEGDQENYVIQDEGEFATMVLKPTQIPPEQEKTFPIIQTSLLNLAMEIYTVSVFWAPSAILLLTWLPITFAVILVSTTLMVKRGAQEQTWPRPKEAAKLLMKAYGCLTLYCQYENLLRNFSGIMEWSDYLF